MPDSDRNLIRLIDAPPISSVEAEMSLLGSLILSPPELDGVAPIVRADDFSDEAHANIFAALVKTYESSRSGDLVQLTQDLLDRGQLNDVGGPDYLLRLADSVPTAVSAPHYARIVREKADRRRARALGLTLAHEAGNADGRTASQLVARAREALDRIDPIQDDDHEEGPPEWRPFPTHALPDTVREFIENRAESIGCDPSVVAVPLLVAAAGVIGTSAVVSPRAGWTEPACLWAAVVAESGDTKSPALEAAFGPVAAIERRLLREHTGAKREHEVREREFRRAEASWRHKGDGDPPDKPEPPVLRRVRVQDTTVEAVAVRLRENPRGLVLTRDELSAWWGSFDGYKSSRGADAPAWLEIYGGRTLIVDRKSSAEPIIVPRAQVSIVGAIPPDVLIGRLTPEHLVSGMAARFLFVRPPIPPRRFRQTPTDPRLGEALDALFAHLFALAPATDEHGEDAPRVVMLNGPALARFAAFMDGLGEARAGFDPNLKAAAAKLEGAALRIALVLHLLEWSALGGAGDPGSVGESTMMAAIEVVEFFINEARRLYAGLTGSAKDKERTELIELARANGGALTVAELRKRRPGRYKAKREAKAALQRLVDAGDGTWDRRTSPQGGRPPERFVLRAETPATTLVDPAVNAARGVLGVSGFGYPRTGPSGPSDAHLNGCSHENKHKVCG